MSDITLIMQAEKHFKDGLANRNLSDFITDFNQVLGQEQREKLIHELDSELQKKGILNDVHIVGVDSTNRLIKFKDEVRGRSLNINEIGKPIDVIDDIASTSPIPESQRKYVLLETLAPGRGTVSDRGWGWEFAWVTGEYNPLAPPGLAGLAPGEKVTSFRSFEEGQYAVQRRSVTAERTNPDGSHTYEYFGSIPEPGRWAFLPSFFKPTIDFKASQTVTADHTRLIEQRIAYDSLRNHKLWSLEGGGPWVEKTYNEPAFSVHYPGDKTIRTTGSISTFNTTTGQYETIARVGGDLETAFRWLQNHDGQVVHGPEKIVPGGKVLTEGTSIERNSQGKVLNIEVDQGRSMQYEYGSDGELSKFVDDRGIVFAKQNNGQWKGGWSGRPSVDRVEGIIVMRGRTDETVGFVPAAENTRITTDSKRNLNGFMDDRDRAWKRSKDDLWTCDLEGQFFVDDAGRLIRHTTSGTEILMPDKQGHDFDFVKLDANGRVVKTQDPGYDERSASHAGRLFPMPPSIQMYDYDTKGRLAQITRVDLWNRMDEPDRKYFKHNTDGTVSKGDSTDTSMMKVVSPEDVPAQRVPITIAGPGIRVK